MSKMRALRATAVVAVLVGLATASLAALANPGEATQVDLAAHDTVDVDYTPDGSGYWITRSDGEIVAYNALHFGDRPDLAANESVQSLAVTPTGLGYWLITTTGRVTNYGDAIFRGDLTTVTNGGGTAISDILSGPVIGSATTSTGQGYWLVGSDGGIFSFGDAAFYGSMGGIPLNAPVVGLAPTATDRGYWLVASDGGIFSFGDAAFYGSLGGVPLNAPVSSLIPQGSGYMMVASDGGIFSFGDSKFFGSLGGQQLAEPIVTATPVPDATGYLLVDRQGGVSAFGSATVLAELTLKPTTPSVPSTTTQPTATSVPTATSQPPEPGNTTKLVIHVSIDGMRPDYITGATMPNLTRLIGEGASTMNARTDPSKTVTLPNHTSQFTGRPVEGPNGHGVDYNSDLGRTVHDEAGTYVASVFDVVHDNGGRTAMIVTKTKFEMIDRSWNTTNGAADTTGEDNGTDKIDVFSELSLADATAAATSELSSPDLEYLFFHIRTPDSTGHANEWGSTEYGAALATADASLGALMDAVQANAELAQSTAFVVVADHGGDVDTKGHGDSTEVGNYTIPFIVWGPGVTAGADLYDLNPGGRSDPGSTRPGLTGIQPIREHEVSNVALDLLGYDAIPGSVFNAAQDLAVSE